MGKQAKFYHQDTEKKLLAVENYLKSFLSVMKNQNFETIYIDAFAGSGTLPINNDIGFLDGSIDAGDFVLGSAARALALGQKFTRYIFVEEQKSKIDELKAFVATNSGTIQNVDILTGDANDELMKLCPMLKKPNVRAVVFLDPFGNQVGWDLLHALAETQHVDLWYLFPSMLGVYRQIGNVAAKMEPNKEKSLDRLFGPNDWRGAFIKRTTTKDLFGDHESESKVANVEDITRFKIQCLKTIFKGGVSDSWLPLGRNNSHWYSLLFAMANPSTKAVKAGHAIANAILKKK